MERKSGKLAVLKGNCPICGRKLQDAWDTNKDEIWVICENPNHYLFFDKIKEEVDMIHYELVTNRRLRT